MSRQTKLSRFAIAAAALLTASVPCLAQNELNKARTDSSSIVAVASAPETDEMTAIYASTPSTRSDVAANENRSTFSATKFMNAAKQSVSKHTFTVVPNTTELTVNTWDISRVDNFVAPKQPSGIEFVPSRGQRLPDKQ